MSFRNAIPINFYEVLAYRYVGNAARDQMSHDYSPTIVLGKHLAS